LLFFRFVRYTMNVCPLSNTSYRWYGRTGADDIFHPIRRAVFRNAAPTCRLPPWIHYPSAGCYRMVEVNILSTPVSYTTASHRGCLLLLPHRGSRHYTLVAHHSRSTTSYLPAAKRSTPMHAHLTAYVRIRLRHWPTTTRTPHARTSSLSATAVFCALYRAAQNFSPSCARLHTHALQVWDHAGCWLYAHTRAASTYFPLHWISHLSFYRHLTNSDASQVILRGFAPPPVSPAPHAI